MAQVYKYDKPFTLESGEVLPSLEIAYDTFGVRNGDDSNIIWVCHALTANSDVADWWPHTVEEGRFLDPTRYFIVCANFLGSHYGTTSPLSVNPATGEKYYYDFPRITVRDIVRANDLVREHLGIERIHFMVGGSIGGFQSVEWSIMKPEVIKKAVYIACGARVTPWLTAFNESMRMAMEADPTFRRCESLKGGEAGLRCARSIALISYRSYQGYNLKQSEQDEDFMFASRCASYCFASAAC